MIDEYLRSASTLIEEGDIQSAMTQLRIGANTQAYSNIRPSKKVEAEIKNKIEKSADSKRRAALLVVFSIILILKDNIDDAMVILFKAEELDPQLAEIYNTKAVLLMNGKKFEKALIELDTAIRLNPTYMDALTNRASVCLKLGKWDNAVADSIKFQTLLGRINYSS